MTTSAATRTFRAPFAHLLRPNERLPTPNNAEPKQPLTWCFASAAQVTALVALFHNSKVYPAELRKLARANYLPHNMFRRFEAVSGHG